MDVKQFTDVTIDGKTYHLGGYESEAYLQEVAAHVNRRLTELKAQNGYARQSEELQTVLLCLNLADDYTRKKAEADELAEQVAKLEKEVYVLKHDCVVLRMENEALKGRALTIEAGE